MKTVRESKVGNATVRLVQKVYCELMVHNRPRCARVRRRGREGVNGSMQRRTAGWQPIKTVPKNRIPLVFLAADGEEYDGRWLPYWCGKDCPCDVAGEGLDFLPDEPECWCAYREGHGIGERNAPTHWKPRHVMRRPLRRGGRMRQAR